MENSYNLKLEGTDNFPMPPLGLYPDETKTAQNRDARTSIVLQPCSQQLSHETRTKKMWDTHSMGLS